MEFSKRLELFGDEIFASLNDRKNELLAQGKKIYNFSIGTPDFTPQEHIKKALIDAAEDPENWKYSLRDLPEMLHVDVSKLEIGQSLHVSDIVLPAGVKCETPSQTEIVIKGADKQKVGQTAAVIRSYRAPEPYKGKGVRYVDEVVVIKETKKK